jgi:hypothetical protein
MINQAVDPRVTVAKSSAASIDMHIKSIKTVWRCINLHKFSIFITSRAVTIESIA